MNNSASAFWNWFRVNEKEFFDGFPGNRKELEGIFSEKLREINKEITFLIGFKLVNGKIDLTLSPNGMSSAFSDVSDLKNSVPVLNFWRVKTHFP